MSYFGLILAYFWTSMCSHDSINLIQIGQLNIFTLVFSRNLFSKLICKKKASKLCFCLILPVFWPIRGVFLGQMSPNCQNMSCNGPIHLTWGLKIISLSVTFKCHRSTTITTTTTSDTNPYKLQSATKCIPSWTKTGLQ